MVTTLSTRARILPRPQTAEATFEFNVVTNQTKRLRVIYRVDENAAHTTKKVSCRARIIKQKTVTLAFHWLIRSTPVVLKVMTFDYTFDTRIVKTVVIRARIVK